MALECIRPSERLVALDAAERSLVAVSSRVADQVGKLDEPSAANIAGLESLDLPLSCWRGLWLIWW